MKLYTSPKYLYMLPAILLFLCILFFSLNNIYADQRIIPKLFFSYSRLYDGVCSKIDGNQIDPTWIQEAQQKIHYFEEIWLTEGSIIMNKLITLFGVGFKRTELTSSLSACPNSPSFSDPLVLNISRYLKTYMGQKPARLGFHFADQVFHELLHIWVRENLQMPSPLLEKYKNEPQIIKNHLHLMAVQQFVYSELKRDDLIKWINMYYSNLPEINYNRAWEIVSKLEGAQVFVSEFKQKKAMPKQVKKLD